MTQVWMTLTEGQISPKMGMKLNNWPYLTCYFTHTVTGTDIIQVPMTVRVTGQGQIFKKWVEIKQLAISRMLVHLQTFYFLPRYNPLRHIQ